MSQQEVEMLLALPGTPDILTRKLPYHGDRLLEKLDDLYRVLATTEPK
jgi:hypothetical protein